MYRKKYTYVVLRCMKTGPFGTLGTVVNPSINYKYLARYSSYVSVDSTTGVLKLKRKFRSRSTSGIEQLTLPVDIHKTESWRITVEKIELKVIILPLHYGDNKLVSYLNQHTKLMKPDNIFSSHVTAKSLHRLMRKIPKNMCPRAFQEAMSSMSVEKTIALIEREIIKNFVSASGKPVFTPSISRIMA